MRNKKSFVKLALALIALTGGVQLAYAEDGNAEITETVSVKNDVTLRSGGNKAGTAIPSEAALELKNGTDDRMVGLMSFDIPTKTGYAVKSATLRLVTERAKGTMEVYVFGGEVTDADTYNSQKTNVEAALAGEKLLSVKLAGTSNKAMTDDGASSTLAEWVNNLDITTAVKNANGTLALMYACESGTSIKVYSSDAKDVTNTKVTPNFTFAAADLKPVLTIVYEVDENYSLSSSTSTIDTWIRKGNSATHGTETTMELSVLADASDASKDKAFLGLMAFELPEAALSNEYEIESATLRLVTERVKGSKELKIYAYPDEFAENTVYATEETKVTTALSASPIATISSLKGSSKAMGSDALDDGYKTVDAWTNTVDVTEYVKTLTDKTFGILLQPGNNANSNKIYTREITDVTNAKDASVTFAAADLKPLLTVVCKKRPAVSVSTSETANIEGVGHVATFFQTYATVIPEGVACYYAASTANSSLTMKRVKNEILPANTGVVVVSETAGDYSFAPATTTATAIEGNLLTGTAEEKTVEASSVLTLGKGKTSNAYGFYTYSGTTIKAHRAYIEKSAVSSEAKALTLIFDDSETTGIGAVEQAQNNDEAWYTLQGVRLSAKPTESGIYVHNHKKIIIK